MIQKEIIDLIARRAKTEKKTLIEKDIILQRVLLELSKHKFDDSYAFKGGTCLIKCYLGYYRFSEDLDFTFIDQNEFKGKSNKQVTKILSEKTDKILVLFKEIASHVGLEFKGDKGDKRYVDYGGSNRQLTLKLWYTPSDTPKEMFIKIQINFEEELFYPVTKKDADNIFFGREKDFETAFLLPENSEWLLQTPRVTCYDIREILIEKVRAVLTRKSFKQRDIIDIFLITKKNHFKLEKFKEQIIRKTKFMLKFEKYTKNIANFNTEQIVLREEEQLMLIPLDKEFSDFVKKLQPFLSALVKEIQK